tara:strand:+ start:3128 stop:3649 length:522 start_codon:yes stop_codon:yes gene_type:complete
MRVVPLTLADANAVVAAIHRHHAPATGHRFSIGVVDDDGLIRGVAIVGRPVARAVNHRMVCEVLRVATDGTRNACSALLGAAARTAKGMGFARIQTYTLPEEGGASLRGAGWECEGAAGGGQWVRSEGTARRTDQPLSVKSRWCKRLADEQEYRLPEVARKPVPQLTLFSVPA